MFNFGSGERVLLLCATDLSLHHISQLREVLTAGLCVRICIVSQRMFTTLSHAFDGNRLQRSRLVACRLCLGFTPSRQRMPRVLGDELYRLEVLRRIHVQHAVCLLLENSSVFGLA